MLCEPKTSRPKARTQLMGYARKSLICLNDTPYYHVIARCVRRAWLCGVDEYARKDYSHRKLWVLERLRQLSSVFAIDICAYAVMTAYAKASRLNNVFNFSSFYSARECNSSPRENQLA